MARVLTPVDGYIIMQDVVNQLMGANAPKKIDATNFVSVGDTVAQLPQEKVFNAINISLGRFVMAVRPVDEAFNIINAINTDAYNHRFRKVSFYSKNTKPSGAFNTDLYTNHATGYTAGTNGGASTPSQWEQNLAIPLEMDFGGSTTWQYCVTNLYLDGKYAFQSESEWIAFIDGYMTQHANDMAMEREAFKRFTFASHIGVEFVAGTSAGGANSGVARNLTAEFNSKFGTSYTTAQLLSTYLSDFLPFFVATVKKDTKRLRRNTTLEHFYPVKSEGGVNYHLPRHTPRSKQKMVLLDNFWIDAEAYVMPKIFNDEYLDIGNFEAIEYWLNPSAPESLDIEVPIPAWLNTIMNGVTSTETTAEAKIDYFLGAIFDEDAVLTDMQVEKARTSGIEARKDFSNTWYTFAKNAISDPTEKCIIYYLSDVVPNLTITPTADTVTLYDGKVASDLQSNVVITDNGISLTSKFIEGGLAESGPLAGDGYFMALSWSVPGNDITSVKVGVVPSQSTGLVEGLTDPDRTVVVKLNPSVPQNFVIVSTDGVNTNTQSYPLSITLAE